MTTYRIKAPHFVAALIRDGDSVVQSAPILGWTVGKEWQKVVAYMNQKGWTIEPLLGTQITHITHDDEDFDIHYNGNRITRITKHVQGEASRDLTHDELTDLIKELIQ